MRQVFRRDGKAGFATVADHAFVLKADDIRRLDSELSKILPEIEFVIHCADGSEQVFVSITELLGYDNAPRHRITTLNVLARDGSRDAHYHAVFDSSFFQPLYVAVNGPAEIEKAAETYTTDLFEGIKAWYSAFHPIYFAFAATVALIAGIGGLKIGPVDDPRYLPGPERQTVGDRLGAWMPLLLMVPSVFIGVIVYRFTMRIFPTGTFAIGYEQNQYQQAEAVRWGAIIALFVSLIANLLLSGYIVDFFSGLFKHLYG